MTQDWVSFSTVQKRDGVPGIGGFASRTVKGVLASFLQMSCFTKPSLEGRIVSLKHPHVEVLTQDFAL